MVGLLYFVILYIDTFQKLDSSMHVHLHFHPKVVNIFGLKAIMYLGKYFCDVT